MTKQQEHSVRTALNDLELGALSNFATSIWHLYLHQAKIKRSLSFYINLRQTHTNQRTEMVQI